MAPNRDVSTTSTRTGIKGGGITKRIAVNSDTSAITNYSGLLTDYTTDIKHPPLAQKVLSTIWYLVLNVQSLRLVRVVYEFFILKVDMGNIYILMIFMVSKTKDRTQLYNNNCARK